MIFHLLHVTLCICFFWAETNGPKSRTVFSTAWFHKHLQPQIPEHTHITAEVSIFFSFLLPEIHILWDNFSCCWFSIKYFLYYDSLKHFLLCIVDSPAQWKLLRFLTWGEDWTGYFATGYSAGKLDENLFINNSYQQPLWFITKWDVDTKQEYELSCMEHGHMHILAFAPVVSFGVWFCCYYTSNRCTLIISAIIS